MRFKICFVATFAIAALAACGGGSSGTPPTSATPSQATSAPTATPSPSPSPSVAYASGMVVDFDSDAGLTGVTVAIAPYSATAAPVVVATTSPSGAFAFTAAPGSYLLEIGSNSPTDTRASYHNKITIVAGANMISQGVPSPEPDVTLAPSQLSGNFRLAALSNIEQDCVNGMNQGRASSSLPVVIPDENGFEYTRATNAEELAQSNDTPAPLYGYGNTYGALGVLGLTTDAQTSGSTAQTGPCDAYTDTYSFTPGNPPYQFATAKNSIWYAATFGYVSSNNSQAYAVQIFQGDPR